MVALITLCCICLGLWYFASQCKNDRNYSGLLIGCTIAIMYFGKKNTDFDGFCGFLKGRRKKGVFILCALASPSSFSFI